MTMQDRTGTQTTMSHTVAGVFNEPRHAEMALNELKDAGFTPDQVSVVARDTRETKDMVERSDMAGAETSGATAGAFLGGITGGIVGWLVGIGALAIPGIGPIVAAGPIAAALGTAGATAAAGAGIGVVAGGLIGALTGWGFSEAEAKAYQDGVERGDILLAIEVPDDGDIDDRVEDVLKRDGGDRVSTGTVRH